MKCTKAIIFDFDDTLVHYSDIGIPAHIAAARELGYEITKKDIKGVWGLAWDSMIKYICPGADAGMFKKIYRKKAGSKERHAVSGVKNMLAGLKRRGYILAVLSSRSRTTLLERMKISGIGPELFEMVVSADKKKTDSFAPVIKHMSALGISKDEILYVGDTPLDYEAAVKSQIRFVGVLTGIFTRDDFTGIGVGNVIESAASLPGHIGSGNLK